MSRFRCFVAWLSLVLGGFAGVCAHAQAPKLASGLSIPDGRTPWATDTFEGKDQLVPIHHSRVAVNRHTGANVAESLAGSVFYKPKLTTELDSAASRTQLHSKTPVFYLLTDPDPDNGGDAQNAETMIFAIVRVAVTNEKRIVDNLSYTQFTGNAKRHADLVEATTTHLADGWLRIEPQAPMEEGEYCILPIPKTSGTYATSVYDFGIHHSAANVRDAVSATSGGPGV